MPAPFERRGGRVAREAHGPAAVRVLLGGEPVELGLDDLSVEQRPDRAARVRREVQRAHHLVLQAAADVDEPVRGDVLAQARDQAGRLGLGVVDGVEELEREGQLERVRLVAQRGDRVQAPADRAREPRVVRHGRVAARRRAARSR